MTAFELESGTLHSVLLRSLDPSVVLDAARRLAGSETERSAALSRTSFLCFRIPAAEDIRAGVRQLLTSTLADLIIPGELIAAFIPPHAVAEPGRTEAIDWLAAWRYLGDLNEPVPNHAPTDTVCIVRAEDVICDLLMQPFDVLQSYLEAFIATWKWPIEHALQSQVHPQLRAWDPDLALAEVEITRLLGYKFDHPVRVLHSLDAWPSENAAVADRGQDVETLVTAGLLLPLDPQNTWPWALNLEPCVDEVWAPFPISELGNHERTVVDPFYGQVYHRSTLAAGSVIYGATEDVLVLPDRASADQGFLRVPFRAIARHSVSSRSQFEDALQRIHESAARTTSWRTMTPDHWNQQPLLFRGQTAEHELQRPKEGLGLFLDYFYGDPRAFEPSLVSSAERRGGRQPVLESLWGALVHGAAIRHGPAPIEPDEAFIFRSREGDLIKLALAQHYGLPTPALDVTSDHLVALWFAFHRLRVAAQGQLTIERIPDDSVAVLYVFDVPQGWAFSGELTDVASVRPSRQHGAFVPISWGLRRNHAARYLVGALYFRGALASEFAEELPTGEMLFPAAAEDPITETIDMFARFAPDNRLLEELRNHVYTVI